MDTMDINLEDTVICLREFGILEPVKEWKVLADGPDHPVPYDVIRKIIYVELMDGRKYVIKFVREPVFPTEIIENQSKFSDLLMEYGIDTPKRLKKDGHYCIPYEKERLVMDVYAEEWVGEKIPHLTMDMYGEIGSVMGKIHRISVKTKFHIGFSLLYNEIAERDTSYERLWRNGDHSLIPEDEYQSILRIYNQRLDIIKNVWKSLPRAAVQGDIYSCNNIAIRNNGLVVYDFNLAGDEVLIGDILQCWFRTIFDEKIEGDLKKISREEMWSVFIKAYQSERQLQDIEKKYFSDVYAILGAVYYTKLLNYWMATGEVGKARDNYLFLFDLLGTKEVLF